MGEIAQIPILLRGFKIEEIGNIIVYRIYKSDSSLNDTFLLNTILWANHARSTDEIITDQYTGMVHYQNYFHNCDLIFDWYTGKDTLSNIQIIKSREDVEGCHKNAPNVKIDKLTFVHKGKIVTKDESIQINKWLLIEQYNKESWCLAIFAILNMWSMIQEITGNNGLNTKV